MRSGVLTRRARSLLRSFRTFAALHPAVHTLLRTLAAAATAFVLAAAELRGKTLPLCPAFLASLPFGLPCMAAFAGASAGLLAFQGASEALTPIAACFLILTELGIFRGLLPRDKRWFLPASAAALYGLLGFIQLLQERFAPEGVLLFAVRTAAVFFCGYCLGGSRRVRRSALAMMLLCAFCRLRLPGALNFGVLAAVCVLCLYFARGDGLAQAAACGLICDLSCGSSLTAAFCLSALMPVRGKPARIALTLLCCGGFTLFAAETPDVPLFLSCVFGALTAFVLPVSVLPPESAVGVPERQDRLGRASDLLVHICTMLGRPVPQDDAPASAAVFDRAAEQVCRSCGKWDLCWDACAGDTYLALSNASARILQRGRALREDLPAFFVERCRYCDGFLSAVNDAIDEQRRKRQYQTRLAESRTVIRTQYQALAELLQSLCEPAEPPVPAQFRPELGYRACGIRCDRAGGDRGCSFSCGEWYYLLLCDGMGTGAEAGRESADAMTLLRGLICVGLDAEQAMQLLNGVYLLREDGGFSTVDLLRISLATGEGTLLKWGAAPSFLRSGKRVVRLGSALPPPGTAAWDGAECTKVSLRRGELLVLTSDGISDVHTERELTRYEGKNLRELASRLAEGQTGDDRTAAVLTLRPIRKKSE